MYCKCELGGGGGGGGGGVSDAWPGPSEGFCQGSSPANPNGRSCMAAENLVGKQGDLTRPENCPRRPAITERFVLGSESTPLPLTAAPPALPRPGLGYPPSRPRSRLCAAPRPSVTPPRPPPLLSCFCFCCPTFRRGEGRIS